MTRRCVLDTETTGFSYENGDRIIEIGIVELIDRRPTGRVFHRYTDPGFEIPEEATKVHGLTREDVIHLGDGKKFVDIADEMLAFIDGAELVIHNAAFDMGFLDKELAAIRRPVLSGRCPVFDTLRFAGVQFPGMRNNLDALCKRFGIDTSERTEHGALLDAQLLTDVYLALTRHQVKLDLEGQGTPPPATNNLLNTIKRVDGAGLPVIAASAKETQNHQAYLKKLAAKAGQEPHWKPVEEGSNKVVVPF